MKRVAMGLIALVLAVAVGHAQQVSSTVFATYAGEMTTQKNDLPPLSSKQSVRVEIARVGEDGGTVQLVLKNYRLPSPRVSLAPMTLNNLTLTDIGNGKWQIV